MWNENTMNALRAWIGRDTWHTQDARDLERFYNFVLAVWHEQRSLWDESRAREVIKCEAQKTSSIDAAYLADAIDKHMTKGTTVLDFLSLTRVAEP